MSNVMCSPWKRTFTLAPLTPLTMFSSSWICYWFFFVDKSLFNFVELHFPKINPNLFEHYLTLITSKPWWFDLCANPCSFYFIIDTIHEVTCLYQYLMFFVLLHLLLFSFASDYHFFSTFDVIFFRSKVGEGTYSICHFLEFNDKEMENVNKGGQTC